MTEPEQIVFQERVAVSVKGQASTSLPVRTGMFAGTAALVVIGVVAAMGASPAAPSTGSQADPLVAVETQPGANLEAPFGFRGGFGHPGFHEITIAAIN